MWVPRFERIEESMAGWDERAFVRASHKADAQGGVEAKVGGGYVKLNCMSGFQFQIWATLPTKLYRS